MLFEIAKYTVGIPKDFKERSRILQERVVPEFYHSGFKIGT